VDLQSSILPTQSTSQLCASINNIIIPNNGTLVLVNIHFKKQLAHIVYVNSLVMINIPFGMHMALYVHVKTLFMAYVFFKTCLTLAMAYILVRMHLAPHAPFETRAMA
jgi:hypothetical protein